MSLTSRWSYRRKRRSVGTQQRIYPALDFRQEPGEADCAIVLGCAHGHYYPIPVPGLRFLPDGERLAIPERDNGEVTPIKLIGVIQAQRPLMIFWRTGIQTMAVPDIGPVPDPD
jgi:hypothetical protein